MTLTSRLAMALTSATVALHASAAPIEFAVSEFELAAGEAVPVWFEPSSIYLKRLGDIGLEPLPPATAQSAPQVASVPEPSHYNMLLAGIVLLLVGAPRGSYSPWNPIKVSQEPD